MTTEWDKYEGGKEEEEEEEEEEGRKDSSFGSSAMYLRAVEVMEFFLKFVSKLSAFLHQQPAKRDLVITGKDIAAAAPHRSSSIGAATSSAALLLAKSLAPRLPPRTLPQLWDSGKGRSELI
ncbi:hypothetical protein Y032_0001g382 [Ancylostoma ceylanicum]|uniref:Uncharacterized protein n=1 Tax=Ancylostoma ceylanicum TaxID=53326 RepID=A0A016W3Z3_9BILA|nr:hypothetical protein Y032_0001g382 [Ancylostoma ceylanicum]